VAGGPERGGIHRRGWVHRRDHRRSPALPVESAEVAGPDQGDGSNDTPEEVDPLASLDQVLRRAAEARDAERDLDN